MRPWSPKRVKNQQEDDHGRCYLMELPTELLLEIISHLTVLPEAALALTNKRMFAISGDILLSKSLRFSRDFAPLFHHYRNGHNFFTPRWSFLNLLENSRWKLCSKCLKLHPRASFSSRELRRKPETRTCNVGELAGVVDLCPCKKLTFRDKLDLADHVRVRQAALQPLKLNFGAAVDNRYCWHTCTEQYGLTELKTSLFPEINADNQLTLRTEYELTTESGQVGKEDYMTPRFGCAHRSVDLWLSSVHQTTICRLFDSFCSSCKRISVCKRHIHSGRKEASVVWVQYLIRLGEHKEFIQPNLRPNSSKHVLRRKLPRSSRSIYHHKLSNHDRSKDHSKDHSQDHSFSLNYNPPLHLNRLLSHLRLRLKSNKKSCNINLSIRLNCLYNNLCLLLRDPDTPNSLLIPPPAMPVHVAPIPSPITPKPNTQNKQAQPNIHTPQVRPIIKAEPTLAKISPKVEPQKKLSTLIATTPIATPKRPQPAPSPVTHATPQVMIPATSPVSQAMNHYQTPKKQLQPQHIEKKRQPSQPNVEKHGKQTPSKATKPPVDYQVLLLSLADEYLNAAHARGTTTSLTANETDVEEYYKLVATGLGCLEAVLKNWRLQPRKEALVRLRYARTLFEETDNDIEAETALSKGIDLCERNRMLDLKYSMQHLLARMLHKSNPKASLKAVDGMIQDVEAYRHAAWEYAFRFLRVSLSLSSPSHQDSVQALQHLHKIAAMASRNGDKAVSAMAAVIESLAHLQQATNSDSIEQAQRAVAAARSHQLNDELRHIPQLTTLIQMVDICCSLLEYDVNQSGQKLKVMQALMDETLSDSNWRPDGSFSVPLNGKSAGPSSIDTGDILQVHNGTLLLSFNWLPQHDLYALCYFLSSITLSAKNSYDGRKAEKYLEEGLRMVQGNFKAPQEISESMVNANRRVQWRQSLYCNLLLQRVFLACARTDWDLASQTLNNLRHVFEELGSNLLSTIECLMEYAAGTIAQATGDLQAALNIFQSPILSLDPTTSKTGRNDPCRDTRVLAGLNTVLILRDPSHPSHSLLSAVLATLEPFCQSSPNKYIQAAYYLVCATVHSESTIQTKQYLQQALQSATAISNSQITCMTLTFMSWKYFRGVVGEQAEKSARAGRAMAKRANDRMWASVTDDMLAETLERQGKGEEAQSVREEGQRLVSGLPPLLRRLA
ncbi:Tetratricopeptide-like helical [Penicillium italicum]|uniref:Tetratricopeptide-like helical n=1 Tax=Penicillium italicum TaxID=40296 RepID=A0A0A2L270_PENIT|nr:Tetratricopeptide-like helical [Penicillium italicum]